MSTDYAFRIEENRLVHKSGESRALEKKFVKKLERIVRGVTQKHPKEDALLINEGKERHGKTNSSIVEALYLKIRTKREAHLFFTLESAMKFARSTKNKIIILDEPSLDSLSKDQLRALNKDMERLFMTIGSHRHIFIINYTKFWKFPEYIVVDRAVGMVHMRTDKIGRFEYVRQRNLENLWNEKRTKNKRAYHRLAAFGGVMPDMMEKFFDEMGFFVNGKPNATNKDYDKFKDEAIEQIGQKKVVSKLEQKYNLEVLRLRKAITDIPMKREELAKILGVNRRRLVEWKKIEIPNP